MKKSLIAPILILVTSLVACSYKTNYRFLNSVDEICNIELVEFNSLRYTEDWDYITSVFISDVNAFIEDFKRVQCREFFGDPQGVEGNNRGIKITYSNSEFEIISSSGQIKYRLGAKIRYYAGYHSFDDDEFNSLINKWSGGALSTLQ